jgi:hypothetical protein
MGATASVAARASSWGRPVQPSRALPLMGPGVQGTAPGRAGASCPRPPAELAPLSGLRFFKKEKALSRKTIFEPFGFLGGRWAIAVH